ncbi:unnamed protein product [Calypogeia fissa]
MATADACRSTCTYMEETVTCENTSLAARRRRKEIRRFKLVASSGRVSVPVIKRTRSFCSEPFSSRKDEQPRQASCKPEFSLTLMPSNYGADAEEKKIDPSTSQSVDCPSGQEVRESLVPSSPTWESTSPVIIIPSSSSGDESTSSGSGSTSSGSSISSDSSGTTLESTEADAGSMVTCPSDISRSAPLDLSGHELPGEVDQIMPSVSEGYLDRQNVLGVRDGSETNDRTTTSTTRGCLSSLHGDRCPPHGLVSVCGRRREMEDAVAAIPAFLSVPRDTMRCRCPSSHQHTGVNAPLHFFGVYDGHGGSQAALFCADRLHHALAEEMNDAFSVGSSESTDSSRDSRWRKAMSACFLRMDAEVGGVCRRGGLCDKVDGGSKCCTEPIAPETVGSTAVVAVVGSCQIIVANCGDSRAVLSRGGLAIALSNDHKPEREDEMARVEAAGGRVIFWNGYRVLGVLAMSRAIGDRYLKPYVIAEPEVTCTERSEDDECLILASDGLWDVLSNDLVCDIARKCLAGRRCSDLLSVHVPGMEGDVDESPASAAAALLTKLALARGSSDNISVVVVDLMARRSG